MWAGECEEYVMTDPEAQSSRVARGTARDRLLNAAEELFAKHGIAGTGTRAIAEHAGTSAGAFFYHFPSKDALVLALITERDPDDHMSEVLARHEDPADALRAVAASMVEMVADQRDTLLLVIRQEGPVPQDSLEDRLATAIETLGSYLYEHLAGISRTQAMAMADTFLTALILPEVLIPSPDPQERADAIVAMLLHGWT